MKKSFFNKTLDPQKLLKRIKPRTKRLEQAKEQRKENAKMRLIQMAKEEVHEYFKKSGQKARNINIHFDKVHNKFLCIVGKINEPGGRYYVIVFVMNLKALTISPLKRYVTKNMVGKIALDVETQSICISFYDLEDKLIFEKNIPDKSV